MTKEQKIAAYNTRIKLLETRGATMNARIIKKLIRRRRALEAQQ
jgi:hypothetical protein